MKRKIESEYFSMDLPEEIFHNLLLFSPNTSFIGLFLMISKKYHQLIPNFISCNACYKPTIEWMRQLIEDIEKKVLKIGMNQISKQTYPLTNSWSRYKQGKHYKKYTYTVGKNDNFVFYMEVKKLYFGHAILKQESLYNRYILNCGDVEWTVFDTERKYITKQYIGMYDVFAWNPLMPSIEQFRLKMLIK